MKSPGTALCVAVWTLAFAMFSWAQVSSSADGEAPRLSLDSLPATPSHYVGPSSATRSLQSGQARPLSLVHADLNGDGVDDLVIGYAGPKVGGILALRLGSLAQRQSFSPFGDSAIILSTPALPSFVAAGQFLGQADLVTAARGDDTLYVFAGNGHASFAPPRSFHVPGPIYSMAAGTFGADLQTNSVIVGAAGPKPSVLLYRRSEQGLSLVNTYPLSAPATSFAFDDLDGDGYSDAIMVSGGRVLILHANGPNGKPQLETLALPFSAVAVAPGYFTRDHAWRRQMAVVDSNGTTHIVVHGAFDPRPWTKPEIVAMRDALIHNQPNPFRPLQSGPATDGWTVLESFPGLAPAGGEDEAPLLLCTSFFRAGTDDILVINSSARQASFISHAGVRPEASTFATGRQSLMPISTAPLAAVAMPVSPGQPGAILLTPDSGSLSLVAPGATITFTVNNTTTDTIDKNPGDGVCADANNLCSLRAAIMEVNAEAAAGTVGPFKITVPAANIQLTIPGAATENASTGHLDVNAPVTIEGKSVSTTTITQTNPVTSKFPGGDLDMVFLIDAAEEDTPAYSVTLEDLTIQGGHASLDNLPLAQGGGIHWEAGTTGTGKLTLTNVAIDGNFATDPSNPLVDDGGGLALFNTTQDLSAAATVTISGASNVANNTAYDAGGGIALKGAVRLTMTDATISGNQAVGGGIQTGGGLYSNYGSDYLKNGKSSLSYIHASTITGNTAGSNGAGEGGGIWTDQSLTIDEGSVISGNSAGVNGGGIATSLQLTSDAVAITASTITGNKASGGSGGGIEVDSDSNPGTGNLQLSFNRIFGNTVASDGVGTGLYNNGTAAATANDNWWGCNEGPVAAAIVSNPISIFNTGTTSPGVLAPVGSVDTHFTLTGTADPSALGPSAFVVTPDSVWAANGPNSEWLSPTSTATTNLNPGDFVYQTTFDLTGLNPATANLAGNIGADDSATIVLNGLTVGSVVGFASLSGFSIGSGFIHGLNTLDFVATNDGTAPNPTGFRVEFTGATAKTATNLCDQVYPSNLVTTSTWVTLANSASPSPVLENAPTTLTAAFQDSNANFSSNVNALENLPVDFSNAVNGALSNAATTTGTTATATATFTPSVSPSGRADVQIDNAVATATVPVEDFALTSWPPTQTINIGTTTATFGFAAAALNGFTGAVDFTITNSSGLTANLSAPSVTNEGAVTLTVQTASAAAGTYSFMVSATGGGLTHQATVQLTIATFSVSITPATQTLNYGVGAVYNVTVTGSGGFSGPLTLSLTGVPSGDGVFAESILNLSSSTTTASSHLTINAPVGSYSFTVYATSSTGVAKTTAAQLVVNIITVGPNTGSSVTDIPYSTPDAWSNPSGIFTDNYGAAASANVQSTWYTTGNYPPISSLVSEKLTTDSLEATHFNFSSFSSPTVNGIQVSITYKATNFNDAIDSTGSFIAQLVKGGVVVGTTLGEGLTIDGNSHTAIIGSSTDLWGTSFVPSDITNSGFGVIFYAGGYSDIGTFPEGLWTFGYTIDVAYVTITVTGG